jgi:O-antigen ligase/tetratricopeptide (TPR) repeat protein
VERLLRWIAAAAALTAVYALVQLLTSNGKFFWIYEFPYRDTLSAAQANFTNRNHFAQFLALGVGPLVWWIQDVFRGTAASPNPAEGDSPIFVASCHKNWDSPPDRLRPAIGRPPQELKGYALALLLGLVFFAGLLSLSRGGIAAMTLAAAIAAALCYRAWAQSKATLVVLVAAGILVAVSLNIFGLDRVSHRLQDFSSGSVERLDRGKLRRSIWTAVSRAIPDYAALGTGVGSHVEVYPIYYSNELSDVDFEFSNAENSYLQVGLETGYPGLLLLTITVVCCGWWCIGGLIRASSARTWTCLGAVTASLAASAVHATVDFIWYTPACMVMVILLAACAARLWRCARNAARAGRPAENQGWMLPRAAYVAGLAVLLPVGGWMVQSQVPSALGEPAWDRFRRARLEMERSPQPGQGDPLDAAGQARAHKAEEQRIEFLETVLRWQPDHARVHLDLAECYLRLFDLAQACGENPMSLGNVRDAALRSRFPSREALDDWLRRAVGEHARYLNRAHEHARQAVALCPLQGRGYLYLAELCFLENSGDATKGAYIDQALRVRPFDGEVLHAVATEALLAGDYDRWLDFARQSFQCGRRHQRRLIADLVGSAPPEALPQMIELIVREFHPDLQGLRDIYTSARRLSRPEPLAWLQQRYAEQVEAEAGRTRGEAAARLWNEARELRAALGDWRRALQCAKNSVASAPSGLEGRQALAVALMEQGQFAEAEKHLRFCLQQRPDDAALQTRWKEALKGRLSQEHETAGRRADPQHY